ncbi:MAG: class I SAM-dependent methyltransferase [Nocardioides sp.]|uniref:class I SAM-dependent methyltransferase n=1 Tax=Nocardioides sp. TaxID=35761 RepID=UPI0039E4DDEA
MPASIGGLDLLPVWWVRPMSEDWLSDTRTSYDADAAGHVEKVRGLLDGNPYLRASLALFAELVRDAGGGLVADVGCGPGYVTRHLRGLEVEAFGVDLSAEMIAIARREYPDLRFEVGTMTDLGWDEHSIAGLLAFWSVIHVPDQAIPGVFGQFHRVLRPGGPLLVGFHAGRGKSHTSRGYTGRAINVDSYRREPREVSAWLRDAGFVIEAELVLRPDDELPGAVVFARNGG